MGQAHASAATIHRFHPDYALGVLTARATLHQCRHFWLELPEEAQEARRQLKVEVTQTEPAEAQRKGRFPGPLDGGCKGGFATPGQAGPEHCQTDCQGAQPIVPGIVASRACSFPQGGIAEQAGDDSRGARGARPPPDSQTARQG